MLTKKRFLASAFALFALFGLSSTAQAASDGFYMGLDMGWAGRDHSSGDVLPDFDITDDKGLGVRYSFGYQVNKYFAIDSGYYYFTDDFFSGNFQRGIDLSGKAMLPFADVFNIFGKLGGAYVYQKGSRAVRPMYALGVSYDINENWVLESSWSRIIGGTSNIHDSDYISAGVAYHFG